MAKGFLRTAALVLLFTSLAAGAYAQITISGGVALSSVAGIKVTGDYAGNVPIDSNVGFGGNVYLDYLLPLSIPLSLGFEVGFDGGGFTVTDSGTEYKETVLAIPLLLRVAYHFDLFPKLDLYAVGKIGVALGTWSGPYRDLVEQVGNTVGFGSGFAFGFDLGAAYYLSSNLGLFAEIGFDDYMLKTKITWPGGSQILHAPFNRFITIGISTKF